MLSFCLSSFFFFWWMNLTLIHIKSCYWSCLFLGLGRVKGLSEGWRSSVFEKLNRNELLFLSSSNLNAERGTHWLSSPDKCKWLPVWEVTSCSFSLDSYSVSRFVLVGFLLICQRGQEAEIHIPAEEKQHSDTMRIPFFREQQMNETR